MKIMDTMAMIEQYYYEGRSIEWIAAALGKSKDEIECALIALETPSGDW